MKRGLFIFYFIALAIHAVILFWLKLPAPKPPKVLNETYVDVALTAPPPPPIPQPPKPISTPPSQKIEAPKPEEKPQPAPPPKPEMTIPEPKPISPPPPKPIVVPSPPPKPTTTDYVPVSQPTFSFQAQHIYPPEAARRHQQGVVVLMLYIGSSGVLDKIEILKSSGWPLLDEAAIREMRMSKFQPALDGAIPIRSQARVAVTYRLE